MGNLQGKLGNLKFKHLVTLPRAEVVAKLVEQSLPTAEIHVLNIAIGKFIFYQIYYKLR